VEYIKIPEIANKKVSYIGTMDNVIQRVRVRPKKEYHSYALFDLILLSNQFHYFFRDRTRNNEILSTVISFILTRDKNTYVELLTFR